MRRWLLPYSALGFAGCAICWAGDGLIPSWVLFGLLFGAVFGTLMVVFERPARRRRMPLSLVYATVALLGLAIVNVAVALAANPRPDGWEHRPAAALLASFYAALIVTNLGAQRA